MKLFIINYEYMNIRTLITRSNNQIAIIAANDYTAKRLLETYYSNKNCKIIKMDVIKTIDSIYIEYNACILGDISHEL